MSFEHEKTKIVNLIQPEFQKIKGTRNEDIFLAEAHLIVAKRGRSDETTKENSQQKKMKEIAREKGKQKS
jgi:hypothetical protein